MRLCMMIQLDLERHQFCLFILIDLMGLQINTIWRLLSPHRRFSEVKAGTFAGKHCSFPVPTRFQVANKCQKKRVESALHLGENARNGLYLKFFNENAKRRQQSTNNKYTAKQSTETTPAQTPTSWVSDNIYNTQKNATSYNLSMFFVSKHLPPQHTSVSMVSGCNQDMLKSKKKRTFNSRYNNRKRVRGQNPLSNIL